MPPDSSPKAGVQSIERLFEVLEVMADSGEIGVSEIAAATDLPIPTVHRLMKTLLAAGYVIQHRSRRYALGPRLIRLGEGAQKMIGTLAQPLLRELAEQSGETANLALLDRDEAIYLAYAPSLHAMRMFTEVGFRVPLHSSAVGKAMLAQLPTERVRSIVGRTGLPRATEKTITTIEDLLADLELIRDQGYALDDGEHELGVRCVATGVTRVAPMMALSISAPEFRLSLADVETLVELLHDAATRLADSLGALVAG